MKFTDQLLLLSILALLLSACGHNHYYTLQESEAFRKNWGVHTDQNFDESVAVYRQSFYNGSTTSDPIAYNPDGTLRSTTFNAAAHASGALSGTAGGVMLLSSMLNDLSVDAQHARKAKQTHAQALIGRSIFIKSYEPSVTWNVASADFYALLERMQTQLGCVTHKIDAKRGYADSYVGVRDNDYRFHFLDCHQKTPFLNVRLVRVESSQNRYELQIDPSYDFHKPISDRLVEMDSVYNQLSALLGNEWVEVRSKHEFVDGEKRKIEDIPAQYVFKRLPVAEPMGKTTPASQ